MAPELFATASPASGTWRVDSETKPGRGKEKEQKAWN